MATRKTVKSASAEVETVKKPATRKRATKPAFEGDQDLFIEINDSMRDSAHQFKIQLSHLYNVEEYYWTGKITPHAKIRFLHKDGRELPVHENTNHGFCLIGNAMKAFDVDNALIVPSDMNDALYVYINPKSELRYIGDSKKHTIYVRIYDNANGNINDRWLTISIE